MVNAEFCLASFEIHNQVASRGKTPRHKTHLYIPCLSQILNATFYPLFFFNRIRERDEEAEGDDEDRVARLKRRRMVQVKHVQCCCVRLDPFISHGVWNGIMLKILKKGFWFVFIMMVSI